MVVRFSEREIVEKAEMNLEYLRLLTFSSETALSLESNSCMSKSVTKHSTNIPNKS